MNPTRAIVIALLVVNLACSESGSVAPPPEEPGRPAQVETVDPLPPDHPVVSGLNVLSRGPRRMSVEQLERSIEAFGGFQPGSVVIPPNLAQTLGQPDYLQTTEENLEPTPLFMKFMTDLGAIICESLANAEATRPIETRLFTRFPALQDNLRHLILVTTGIEGEEAEPYVQRLERVFEAGRRGPRGDVSGHLAVCMAMFTSPEFLLY